MWIKERKTRSAIVIVWLCMLTGVWAQNEQQMNTEEEIEDLVIEVAYQVQEIFEGGDEDGTSDLNQSEANSIVEFMIELSNIEQTRGVGAEQNLMQGDLIITSGEIRTNQNLARSILFLENLEDERWTMEFELIAGGIRIQDIRNHNQEEEEDLELNSFAMIFMDRFLTAMQGMNQRQRTERNGIYRIRADCIWIPNIDILNRIDQYEQAVDQAEREEILLRREIVQCTSDGTVMTEDYRTEAHIDQNNRRIIRENTVFTIQYRGHMMNRSYVGQWSSNYTWR
ncbi:MAG: hypothetical protein JW779_07120 [Candidatus Thorarchaeota archaeon]|nr:hypothetical protein [Candidatus Thorarchaeota archaeon]